MFSVRTFEAIEERERQLALHHALAEGVGEAKERAANGVMSDKELVDFAPYIGESAGEEWEQGFLFLREVDEYFITQRLHQMEDLKIAHFVSSSVTEQRLELVDRLAERDVVVLELGDRIGHHQFVGRWTARGKRRHDARASPSPLSLATRSVAGPDTSA